MPSLTEGLRDSGDGDLPPPFIMVWLGDKKGPDPPSPVDGFGFGRKYKANSNYGSLTELGTLFLVWF